MDGPFVLTLFCARYIMECNLWEFGPRGGITLDSEGWLEAIRKFWEKNQSVENRDFMRLRYRLKLCEACIGL